METCALHLAKLKPAISPNVGGSDAQFLVVGDCVRASPVLKKIKLNALLTVLSIPYTVRGREVSDARCLHQRNPSIIV